MSLMPSNSSPLQHALARLAAMDIAAIDHRLIIDAGVPDAAASHLLPYLAWQNSIGTDEGWDFANADNARRELIKNTIEKHRKKGTPFVIRWLFRELQLGEIDIIEKVSNQKFDGAIRFDGVHVFGGHPSDWAKYAILVKRPITNKQAGRLREILAQITPARCKLIYIDYRGSPVYWNGEIAFNGTYNFGVA